MSSSTSSSYFHLRVINILTTCRQIKSMKMGVDIRSSDKIRLLEFQWQVKTSELFPNIQVFPGWNDPFGADGVHGCPEEIVQKHLPNYWKMRYDLFSKYEEGIQLDYESWYSVTPEVIAKHIAQRCKISNGSIIDAFCGCGGNSIQFAKLMRKVIAVDIDPVKIKYAENNARIYGVLENIQFIVGDFMKLAPVLKADGIFLSPPWGGPYYLQEKVFDLRTMIPMDGFKVFQLAQNISRNVAYFVPRTTSHEQLLELGGGSPVEIEENILNGRKITYTAYYGDFTAAKHQI